MLNSGPRPVNRDAFSRFFPLRPEPPLGEYASRFPLLEHLSWSHHVPLEHHLSVSTIPDPPKEVFDFESGLREGGGERELAEVVAGRYGVPAERVLPCAGLSEGLFVVANAVIEPGDFALVETPGYQSLAGVAASAGATVRSLARGLDGSLDPSRAADAVARTADEARAAGRRLALVLLSDLHNPTSARLSEASVDALAEASRRAGAVFVLDEVYRDVDSGRAIGTAQSRHPEMVTLSSVTKSYGFGSLRSGWMIAPLELREACRRVKLYLSVDAPWPSVAIATRILGAADRILAWARPILDENRRALAAAVADKPSGFVLPQGASVGTTAFVHRPDGPDTYPETLTWRETRRVSVVPGRWFGAPNGVRIGLGRPAETFRKAIEAWTQALAAPVRT
jgi:aspartate/methionine/tyrosine aminotransferase